MKKASKFLAFVVFIAVIAACSSGNDNNDENSGNLSSSSGGGSNISSSSDVGNNTPSSSSDGAPSSSSGGNIGDGGACYLNINLFGLVNVGTCAEGQLMSQEECDLAAEEAEAEGLEYEFEYGTSCPSDYALDCGIDDEGLHVYVYGDATVLAALGMATCEDLEEDDGEEYYAKKTSSSKKHFSPIKKLSPLTKF